MTIDHVLPEPLIEAAQRCADALLANQHTVAVAEGSCGGLVSAGLLALPGASGYYRGGSVIYTNAALLGMLNGKVERPDGLQGATEPWALHLARAAQAHVRTQWAIGEGGAAGPSGNRYGNPAGHAWVAVVGPHGYEASRHVLTGDSNRLSNMAAFAIAGLELLADSIT